MPSLPSKTAVVLTIWFAAIFVAMQALTVYVTIQQTAQPAAEQAIIIDKWEVTTPIVKPTDTVVFDLHARRRFACISIIAAFWIAEDGHAAVRFPPLTGGYTPVNMDGYQIPVEVPAPAIHTLTGKPLPPGLYTYRSTNVPLCDNALPTETPPATVCLVVPGQPTPACAKEDQFG